MTSSGLANPSFPYRRGGDAIDVSWAVEVPGSEREPSQGSGVLEEGMLDLPPNSKIEVTAIVEVDESQLGEFIGKDESIDTVAEMVLLMRSSGKDTARVRDVVRSLEPPKREEGKWSWVFQWKGARSTLAGNIFFRPSLVRKEEGSDNGIARFKGEEVAASTGGLTLLVSDAEFELGEGIEVSWADFSELEPPFNEGLWLMREADEASDPPLVMLNREIKGLSELLLARGNANSSSVRTKNALNGLIAAQVRTELAHTVADQIIRNDPEGSPADLVPPEDDWRFKFLAQVASHGSSDAIELSERDAVANLLGSLKEAALTEELTRVERSVQAQLNLRKALEGFTKKESGAD